MLFLDSTELCENGLNKPKTLIFFFFFLRQFYMYISDLLYNKLRMGEKNEENNERSNGFTFFISYGNWLNG